jgi:multidrug resistance efflux pump
MKGIAAVLLVMAVAAGGWSYLEFGEVPVDATAISLSEIESAEAPATIYGVGYVEPVTEIRRLAFDMTGTIAKLHVSVGQTVPSQHPLVELSSAEEAQAVAVAQQELAVEQANQSLVLRGVNEHRIAAARHSVEARRERLKFWELEYDRIRPLLKSTSVTQSEFEKTSMQVNESRAQLAEAVSELEHLDNFVLPESRVLAAERVCLAEANLRLLAERLEKTRLLAPCQGTVLEVLKHEGEHVTKESQNPVILFGDLSRLRVRGEIDERNAHAIRVGQQVKVYGRNLGDEVHTARIVSIKSVMGQKTIFARTAQERKNLDVLQAFIEFDAPVSIPVGLRVDISIDCGLLRDATK